MYHFEKKIQTFFNILTEPLLVQKPTMHQQKAWDLSYLEPEGHWRGMIRRVPRPLAAKDIEKSKFNFFYLILYPLEKTSQSIIYNLSRKLHFLKMVLSIAQDQMDNLVL